MTKCKDNKNKQGFFGITDTRTFMKTGLVVLWMMLTAMCLAGCSGGEQVLTNEKGEQVEYTIDTIQSNGFYVLNQDTEVLVPLMTGASGYRGLITENDPTRFIWLGTRDADLPKLIPQVDGTNTQLVLIHDGVSGMPENYVLEKYKSVGYTIGANVTFADTGDQMYIMTTSTCDTSMAADELGGAKSEMLPIHRINDSKELPFDNVDTDIMMLLGLEKNKMYKFNLFSGTKYREVELLADTLAFKSCEFIELGSPYVVTENDYFIINLPKNLSNGYYYINDFGLFKYTGDK